MIITTWNVNGLRANLKNGNFSAIFDHGPDILMLQEIKTYSHQIPIENQELFRDYTISWNSSDRPGYSGVATFMRKAPDEIVHGLGIQSFDTEGRLIMVRYQDLVIVNVYVPSGQRDYGRVIYKLDFYDALLKLCDGLHAEGKQVIIGGDFNTAHKEIDLRNPTQNRHTSGFLPEEREWISRFLEHGLMDIYRTMYPDRIQYTWWTYVSNARQRNVGWRLDYFLVSKTLGERITDVIIHNDIYGSDHCPVSLVIK